MDKYFTENVIANPSSNIEIYDKYLNFLAALVLEEKLAI